MKKALGLFAGFVLGLGAVLTLAGNHGIRGGAGSGMITIAPADAPTRYRSGATLCLNGTNDAARIQALFDEVAAEAGSSAGVAFEIGPGTVVLESGLSLAVPFTLAGSGAHVTRLAPTAALTGHMFTFAADPVAAALSMVRDLKVDGANIPTGYAAFFQQRTAGANNGHRDVQFRDCWINQVPAGAYAHILQDGWNATFEHMTWENGEGTCVYFDIAAGGDFTGCWLDRCWTLQQGPLIGHATSTGTLANLKITNCITMGRMSPKATTHHINAPYPSALTIIGNHFSPAFNADGTLDVIHLDYTQLSARLEAKVVIMGNIFSPYDRAAASIRIKGDTAARLLTDFLVANNKFMANTGAVGCIVADTCTLAFSEIIGNVLGVESPGYGVNVANGGGLDSTVAITGNLCMTSGKMLAMGTTMSGRVTGNTGLYGPGSGAPAHSASFVSAGNFWTSNGSPYSISDWNKATNFSLGDASMYEGLATISHSARSIVVCLPALTPPAGLAVTLKKVTAGHTAHIVPPALEYKASLAYTNDGASDVVTGLWTAAVTAGMRFVPVNIDGDANVTIGAYEIASKSGDLGGGSYALTLVGDMTAADLASRIGVVVSGTIDGAYIFSEMDALYDTATFRWNGTNWSMVSKLIAP
ncbi:MAG TPA: hypothetical protein VM243_06450 [Phycisphaerae bacterium]|nr:hypothetical protein [Phycisphaerae bacterium]